MKTVLLTLSIAAGVLLPSAASAMQYDRINPGLPGICVGRDMFRYSQNTERGYYAAMVAKDRFCKLHGPGWTQ